MNPCHQRSRRLSERGGWQPGRRIDSAAWRSQPKLEGLHMHAAAESFLQEFGGLDVWLSGPGISCARTSFELDPALARGEGDRFTEWSASIGRHLYPLGELDHGRFFLGIDEFREIYLVEAWLASYGRMPEALENLVLGVAPVDVTAPDRP
ncbi:SUKH-3 domain-containing protein [Streptomyces sp. NPDC060223]|uniref:SUKH-3 domain-containing protein n=1 Tax=unclassified Streptomyces TaxID=2593676 RepID=UPI003638CEBF